MYHQALSRRDFLGCVLGSSALGAAGCTIIGGPKSRPNIVLAVMDTVRADHVAAWGYHRKTTPHLDGLLGHATKFTRVQAPAPYTLPSHASMFTGRWPSEHGADSQRYVNEQQEPHVRELPLRGEFLTLAERLQQAGYATGAFAANTAYLKPRFNVLQGFETQEIEHIPGVRLVERAIPWVTAQKGPFFLFLNLMDAHRPYNLEPRPGVLEGAVPDDPELLNRLRHAALPGDKPLDPELVRQVTSQYDTGVANADAAVG
ncbi:MAG: sulfatase-like hydrolase/transferase, partial [Candidatus Hydrogenedentes bacterium]|nr:sulfatase-like hydrolase/transferase [Candidatus Hydrogenedentota bacterium]